MNHAAAAAAAAGDAPRMLAWHRTGAVPSPVVASDTTPDAANQMLAGAP